MKSAVLAAWVIVAIALSAHGIAFAIHNIWNSKIDRASAPTPAAILTPTNTPTATYTPERGAISYHMDGVVYRYGRRGVEVYVRATVTPTTRPTVTLTPTPTNWKVALTINWPTQPCVRPIIYADDRVFCRPGLGGLEVFAMTAITPAPPGTPAPPSTPLPVINEQPEAVL